MASKVTQFRKVASASYEQRLAPRHGVVITRATVRNHKQQPVDGVLRDLSVYGCRLASVVEQSPGERLWLRFEGSMPFAATVVWCDKGFIGCRFDTPFPRALLRTFTLTID